MSFDLKKMVLDGIKYEKDYVKEDGNYVISASMIGREPIQNYLTIVHGTIDDEEIGDTTLGSVFHKGMETIALEYMQTIDDHNPDEPVIQPEEGFSYQLENGWWVEGTADLVNTSDALAFQIRDYKLTKKYAHTMFKKEKHSHNYTKQLQTLEALFRKELEKQGMEPTSVELICDFFLKDAKAAEYQPSHEPEVVPNKLGQAYVPRLLDEEGNVVSEEQIAMSAEDVVFEEIIEKTNELQRYLESGEIPPACEDKWIRNVKGKILPTKCVLYCSHGKAGLCPHYDAKSRQSVERLANW